MIPNYDNLKDKLLRLEQGSITIMKYKTQFYKFNRSATSIMIIDYLRILCFLGDRDFLSRWIYRAWLLLVDIFLRFWIMLRLWKRYIMKSNGVAIKGHNIRAVLVRDVVAHNLKIMVLKVGTLYYSYQLQG